MSLSILSTTSITNAPLTPMAKATVTEAMGTTETNEDTKGIDISE